MMQKHENSSNYQQVLLCKLPQSTKVHLAKDWKVKALSEVAKINPETINEKYLHKEILYVDISSIENYEIKMYERLALKHRPSRAQRIIKKYDIVVSNVRPYLRAFAQVRDTKDNLICSTGFTVIRPHSKYDADFIFNYIKSHNFEVNMIRHMEGLAYPGNK